MRQVTLLLISGLLLAACAAPPDRTASEDEPAAPPPPRPTAGEMLAQAAALVGEPTRAAAASEAVLQAYPATPEADSARVLLTQARETLAREAEEASERRLLELLRQKWSYRSSSDPMTSRVTRMAMIESDNTVNFDFPYQGAQRARLTLRDHPQYGRDVLFAIERGQFLCMVMDGCPVTIRFDEGQPQRWTASEPADRSTTVLFIRGYDRFLTQLRRARIVRIQANVYQEGAPVFEFRVGGFDFDRYQGN